MLLLRALSAAIAFTLVAALPLAAATIVVGPADDLQEALDAAQPGDLVLLAAGATFTGNFTLPAKSGAAS